MRSKTGPAPWILILLFALTAFSFRLAFGLYAPSLQPLIDEVQTYLLGLKYYATGAWPYYGNDVVAPPENLALLTQNPGALQALLIGAPLRLWPSPLSPFFLLNLISLGGLSFLAWYASKRLPKLSPWFIFSWVLTAPWCLHYSCGMLNLSYTLAGACFFFVAFMESVPALSLRWMSLTVANTLMGFTVLWNMQLHGTWVLLPPFMAASFYFQWKTSRKLTAPLFFLLGALPLAPLIIPTFLQDNYHFFRDVSGLSPSFNPHNLKMVFTTLAQFFALASFEMPRFIGLHTHDRAQFLAQHWFLLPGFFLWYFGILQVLILFGFLFNPRDPRRDWNSLRLFLGATFLLVYSALLFTAKDPNANTFYEMLPVVMIYSLYIWEQCYTRSWGRIFTWVFLGSVLMFQAGYLWVHAPLKESFYSTYQDKLNQAVQQKDHHILGERRANSLY